MPGTTRDGVPEILSEYNWAKTVTPAILTVLEGGQPSLRSAAAWALARMGDLRHDAEQTFRVLISALRDPDQAVRVEAATAVGNLMYPWSSNGVPALRAALRDPSTAVRSAAAAALGPLGVEAKAATPDLAAALSDPDRGVRASAARALGELGGSAQKDSIPALVAALESEVPEVRAAAAESLGDVGSRSTVQSLLRLMSDGDQRVRVKALIALGRTSSGADEAVPVLLEATQSEQPEIQEAARTAIRYLPRAADEAAEPAVKRLTPPLPGRPSTDRAQGCSGAPWE
jgi:HEAT repeat protein